MHRFAVVVVNGKAKAARAARHRLTDSAHTNYAQTFAPDAMAQHPSRAPAMPVAGTEHPLPLGHAAGHRQHQRHGHIGRILGQYAGGVGHCDAPFAGRVMVDVIPTGAERGDQFQALARMSDDVGINLVCHRWHQDIGEFHRVDQVLVAHGIVGDVQTGVEQLHHPRFRHVRQFAGHDNQWFVL